MNWQIESKFKKGNQANVELLRITNIFSNIHVLCQIF